MSQDLLNSSRYSSYSSNSSCCCGPTLRATSMWPARSARYSTCHARSCSSTCSWCAILAKACSWSSVLEELRAPCTLSMTADYIGSRLDMNRAHNWLLRHAVSVTTDAMVLMARMFSGQSSWLEPRCIDPGSHTSLRQSS